MNMDQNDIRNAIESGKTALGIELGSTRIKAVLIGEDHTPIASGSHEWENKHENGVRIAIEHSAPKLLRDTTFRLLPLVPLVSAP
jgi:activator of 2-hydroxyglutaryl-CoA dehydratase